MCRLWRFFAIKIVNLRLAIAFEVNVWKRALFLQQPKTKTLQEENYKLTCRDKNMDLYKKKS